jgi:protein SCO1
MATRRLFPFMIFLFALTFVFSGKEAQSGTKEKYKRSVENYVIPDVMLVNQNGARVNLSLLLNRKKAAMVDFIYTTCTTICPFLSAGFSNFQKKMGPDSNDVQLVSISIDPEHDTPTRLNEYLKRYDAKPGWDFLTGPRDDIEKVLKSFSAYTQNKMSHSQLVLLYSPAGKRWVRIYGLIGTSDLLKEGEKVFGR